MRRRKIAAEGMVVVKSNLIIQFVFFGGVMGFAAALPARASIDPWADAVISYNAGTNPEAGYTNPALVVGSPERVTGEVTPVGPFPGSVTMFSSPYGLDEIVSIGAGGHLVVRFEEPVIDRPGTDMLIFGNAFFALDLATFSTIQGIVSEPGTVEVSADGLDWRPANGFADGLFPTQGFLDTDAFGGNIGTVPTDFLKPVNSALTINDFLGLTYAQALALYDGSGGGADIDIAGSGLASFQFVRVSVPAGSLFSTEIDAFAAIPEPTSAGMLLIGAVVTLRRRRACRS